MESADRDGVIEKYAMVGYVDDVDRKFPVFAERMAGGGVEGSVDWEIRTVVRALIGAGKAVREAGTIIHIGREPGVQRKAGCEACVECVALIVVERDIAEAAVCAHWVVRVGAGKAADDGASLLGNLIRIGYVELAKVGELRRAQC